MNLEKEIINKYMSLALEQAQLAYQMDEVPVGAVLVHNSKIIAAGHNLVNQNKNCLHHAELLVLEAGFKYFADWRLNDCELYVSLEPCTMCIGAIRAARIKQLVFATYDERMGACGSIYDLSSDPRLGTPPKVISGILASESSDLLSSFFKAKR